MQKREKKQNTYLSILLCVVKSVHLWAWIIFILGTVFCYSYPRIWEQHENLIERAFAPMEWYFIWVIFVCFWSLFYFFLSEVLD